jgi:hypothetical protein
MTYYIIKHRNGCWYDGAGWTRDKGSAHVYRHDQLPSTIPVKTGATELAKRSDLRWRTAGEIVANALLTMVRVNPAGIEYGSVK